MRSNIQQRQRLRLTFGICVALLLILYAIAYVVMGPLEQAPLGRSRYYRHSWLCSFFAPALAIESAVRREEIGTGTWRWADDPPATP